MSAKDIRSFYYTNWIAAITFKQLALISTPTFLFEYIMPNIFCQYIFVAKVFTTIIFCFIIYINQKRGWCAWVKIRKNLKEDVRKYLFFICYLKRIFTAIKLHSCLKEKAAVVSPCLRALFILSSINWSKPVTCQLIQEQSALREPANIITLSPPGRNI